MCYAYDIDLKYSKGMFYVLCGNLHVLCYLFDVAVNPHPQQVLFLLKEGLVNGQNRICLDELLKLSSFSPRVTFNCCRSHLRHD